MALRKSLLTFSIAVVLMGFFAVPIGFLIYGAAGSAAGGFLLIGLLMVLQLPGFLLLKKLGFLAARPDRLPRY